MAAGSVKDVKWRDVKVGQVLEVRDNETFPADLLCLSCKRPDGVAYIRTTNLDGEPLPHPASRNSTTSCMSEPCYHSPLLFRLALQAYNIRSVVACMRERIFNSIEEAARDVTEPVW